MGAQRQQAHGLLELMQPSGLVPDVITYNAAVSSYEKRAQRQQALHPLGGDAAVWPRARHHRIQRCCECPCLCAQWQQALGLLALMQQPGLVSDVITYKQLRVPMRRGATTAGPWSSGSDAAVWSCARCRHLQRCRKCLLEGCARAAGLSPFGGDAAVWSCTHACEKGAQWRQVMQLSGLVPGVITYRLQ
jgi:hypothetical protein